MLFVNFVIFLEKKVRGIHEFFGVILSRLGRSTTRAHKQSVRACGIETHFLIFACFLKTTPKRCHSGVHFGDHVRWNLEFVPSKIMQTNRSNKCSPKWKGTCIVLSQGSLTAPLACALFQEEPQVRAEVSGIAARVCFSRKMLFDLFPLQNFKNLFKKVVTDEYQKHIVDDLTRPRPRPGDLWYYLADWWPLIASASRSPPGLAPKSLTFGALSDNQGTLWCHARFIFRSLEVLWERRGPLLRHKSGLGNQWCPKRRHPGNPFIFGGPIWESFLGQFLFF